jgi:hypothetical protein
MTFSIKKRRGGSLGEFLSLRITEKIRKMIETFQKNFNSLWVFVRNGRQKFE